MCQEEVQTTANFDIWQWLPTQLQILPGVPKKSNCYWESYKIKNRTHLTGEKLANNYMISTRLYSSEQESNAENSILASLIPT